MAIPRIILELPEDHSYVPLARHTVRSLLGYHAVAPQDIADVEVLVGELCSNVTRHARSEEGFFRLTLEHHGDSVVLTVEDHGPGFEAEEVPSAGSVRADENGEERHGGFGLALVRHLADEVVFESCPPRGTRARVAKRLRSRSGDASA